MTYIKVAFIAGLLIASPWVFREIWMFVAAGLYPHERKYIYIYLPMSLTLFTGGAVFCFYAVFPFVLKFLLSFNAMLDVNPQIRLSEWINFAVMLPVPSLAQHYPSTMAGLRASPIRPMPETRKTNRTQGA